MSMIDVHLAEKPSSPARFNRTGAMTALAAVLTLGFAVGPVTPSAAQEKPNIIFIMGDDIGWSNIGVYNQGIMAGRTPNLDRLASEGMRFTDYYAEASCTAGRANFITGEIPLRTGLTTVGQAGSTLGMPDEAPTIATALKTGRLPVLRPTQTVNKNASVPCWLRIARCQWIELRRPHPRTLNP